MLPKLSQNCPRHGNQAHTHMGLWALTSQRQADSQSQSCERWGQKMTERLEIRHVSFLALSTNQCPGPRLHLLVVGPECCGFLHLSMPM